jgi:hypothetical protein
MNKIKKEKSLEQIAIEEQIKQLQQDNEYYQKQINKNNLIINRLQSNQPTE